MELLVVTLAHTNPGRDADGLARMRIISDTVRNIQGLVTARFYRSRGNESYYFILTTWENEDSWQKAQERFSPRNLLLGSATELLVGQPEQWLMQYLWGYSRPTATPILAAAHLATIRAGQADLTQRGWIESLRRQAMQPNIAFAFLARGINEETVLAQPANSPVPGSTGNDETIYQHGSVFLNLLSWASETDREDFYADPNYLAISRFISGMGRLQILPLDLL
ncbi:MAG TPA: antibiotic biosynthesis monooxygenase [Ktedonobacteraceae bacterium]|nr:antibiotic biosynthesis monooxygenase [Ktedonobacteraceae bacterium]